MGATSPTGTANTVVTLSSGKYGAQPYQIEVLLDTASGSAYNNTAQIADESSPAYTTLTVMVPPTTNSMQGDGNLTTSDPNNPVPSTCGTGTSLCAPAGTYGKATRVHYTVGLQYNNGGTNPQGQAQLELALNGNLYYIKSNSISSITCAVTPAAGTPCKDLTIYTKASIYKVDSNGNQTSIDGNVTLRIDAHDGGASADTIGFTVLSTKDGSLYYSNNWVYDSASAAWRTLQQGVSNSSGCAVTIN
jgi:hypothetical protein